MQVLEYRARGEDGRLHTGRVDSARLAALRDDFRARGIYLVGARTVGAGHFVRRTVSRRDLIFVAYHLQTVIRAGVPLMTGLEDLAAQTDNRYLKWVIEDLIDSVESGSTLSQAMARHPRAFPDEFVQMTMAGEISGRLPESFDRLVHLLEWYDELRGQIRHLVSYPIMVLIALLGLITLLLAFVIPRFSGILASLRVELPLPTRVLMAASAFLLQNWALILAFSAALVVVAFLMQRKARVRTAIDEWSLRVPLYGNLRLSLISSQVSHFLGAFIDAGVPIAEGLDSIVRLTGNFHARRIMDRIRKRVLEGDSLSNAFREADLFPHLVLRMISIGEESGTLPDSLRRVGDYYDRDIPRRVKTVMGIATPVLTVVLASILCFVVLAVLLPIYRMYGALS
ncbi:MAG: type II secretion system F family protein [Candidatus Eisenbacteria bacterium]|uniref:Type II secretion system F family protein n=1 Tax=Eiseniibacteriota bacterium TaxID=2212470 RepID=A0A956SEZ6_UNCEI|nr:type II secretion system F family protein [Candidatus Eisenbacteria bacterium]MCB9466314.1 type II secretion system F family protein [Candidatus Eisenbacteria bacterium]